MPAFMCINSDVKLATSSHKVILFCQWKMSLFQLVRASTSVQHKNNAAAADLAGLWPQATTRGQQNSKVSTLQCKNQSMVKNTVFKCFVSKSATVLASKCPWITWSKSTHFKFSKCTIAYTHLSRSISSQQVACNAFSLQIV